MTLRSVLAVIVVALGSVAVPAQLFDCDDPLVKCVDVLECGLCWDGGTPPSGATCVGDPDCAGTAEPVCAGRCENDPTIPCLFASPDCDAVGGACNAPSSGNGTTASPFCRIQDAADQARVEGASPTRLFDIQVAPGTYQECVTAWGWVDDGSGFWDPDLSLDQPIHFVSEDFLLSGDSTTTIIDGTDDCGPLSGTPESTFTIGGTGAELKGFTITGGGLSGVFAQGEVAITDNLIEGNDSELGGGIYILTASCYYGTNVDAVISDNTIRDNRSIARLQVVDPACDLCLAGSAACGTGDGGGIFAAVDDRLNCGQTDDVEIARNTIENNTAENHNFDPCSAVCVDDVTFEPLDPLIAGCADPGAPDCPPGSICDEQIPYTANGGGIFVLTDSFDGLSASATISQNLIAGNSIVPGSPPAVYSEGYGGGIYVVTFGTGNDTVNILGNCIGGTDVNNCTSDATSGNFATLDGGGISARARPFIDGRHTITIDQNTITRNLADRDGGGLELLTEAIEFNSSLPNDKVRLDVKRNLISDNTSNRDGGGLKAVSDIRRTTLADADELTLAIRANVIDNNTSGLGAGGALLIPIADADDFSGGVCDNNPAPAESQIDFTENLVTNNLATADDPSVDVIGGGVLSLPLTFGDATATVMIDQTTVSGNDIGPEGFVPGIETQAVTYYDCLTDSVRGESWLVVDRTIVSDNTCQGAGSCVGIGGPPPGGDILIAAVASSDVFGQSPNYESTLFAADPPAGNISGDPQLDAEFFPAACSIVFDRFCQELAAPATACAVDTDCSPTCSVDSVNRLAPCTLPSDCIDGECIERCVDAVGFYGNPDSDGDGIIDGQEILGIAASFGGTSGVDNRYDEAFDINNNGINDGNDLSRFTSNFGQVCEP